MVIAGEPSGDSLAAELVEALRQRFAERPASATPDQQPLLANLEPRFFGAGGPCLAAAGVDLLFDLTAHSVVGISDVATKYFEFRSLFRQLLRAALERQPDAIICVDFSGFNRRFAHAIRRRAAGQTGWFQNWRPKIIQYVSPQVWASREARAYQMARDYDLLLATFPFEPAWYAQRVPQFPVRFVGNPVIDRHGTAVEPTTESSGGFDLLLLPGSRPAEISRHFPAMVEAVEILRRRSPGLTARAILPDDRLLEQASALRPPSSISLRRGGLRESLRQCRAAIASTGTVTVECAYFGVPTVAMYKTSWITYRLARPFVGVKFLAMPNLLAGEAVYPELIQAAASPANIAREAQRLLEDGTRREEIRSRLKEVVGALGGPGASTRAATAICELLEIPNPGGAL